MMHKRIKILLVGPMKSGKTVISNMLSGSQDNLIRSYRSTVGCRIQEFEKELKGKQGASTKVMVELWDVSGDPKYEKCWLAIQREANGIIFVYDSSTSTPDTEMDYWVKEFPKKMQLKPEVCMAFANKVNPESKHHVAPMKGLLNVECSQDSAQTIHVAFDKYVQNLVTNQTIAGSGGSA